MKKDIHREISVEASIDQVWEAITSRESLSQWYMSTSNFEPVVGCQFVFEDKPQGKWDGKVHGEVLQVEAPSQLVYSFWGNQMKGKTTVRWTLTEEGQNTRIRVDHTGFEGFGDWLIGNIIAFGWRKFLKSLRRYLE